MVTSGSSLELGGTVFSPSAAHRRRSLSCIPEPTIPARKVFSKAAVAEGIIAGGKSEAEELEWAGHRVDPAISRRSNGLGVKA